MTTKLKWRLANRPTPAEVIALKEAGLLKDDEAREILFSLETDEDRDKASLQEEIKFLRQLVKDMAVTRQQIITTIKEVEKPYINYPWYGSYQAYCSTNAQNDLVSGSNYNGLSLINGGGSSLTLSGTANSVMTTAAGSTGGVVYNFTAPDLSFTDIKTF